MAPVAAAAMGAQVIERHITLDRTTPVENFKQGKEYLGTDHVLVYRAGRTAGNGEADKGSRADDGFMEMGKEPRRNYLAGISPEAV